MLVFESDNEDAFPVLRHSKVFGVDDSRGDVIAEVFRECSRNDVEGPATVVPRKSFDVLQQEGFGSVVFNDSGKIEKQRSACIAEPALETSNGKSLAREPADEHVMTRNLLRSSFLVGDCRDIPERNFTKVRKIGAACSGIPLRTKDASSPDTFERQSHSTDTSEKVDKRERRILHRFKRSVPRYLALLQPPGEFQ